MTDRTSKSDTGRDANRDPLSGAPGAHPVGTGVGTAAGTLAGAAIGAMAGPAGAAAGAAIGGAVVGGVAGGLAGKSAAESIDPTIEETYWSKSYTSAPYIPKDTRYDVYRPAYRYGWESYSKYQPKKFEDVEPELARGWDNYRGTSSNLTWDKAKAATRDAWHRVEKKIPGDFDKDGR